MAKIIVTEFFSKGECFLTRERLIDANSKVKKSGSYPSITTSDGENFLVEETIEEIQRRINEAEAQATNQKLDEINKNLKAILRKLDQIHIEL